MISNINFQDKRVLIRVDYNVPVKDGLVIDNYRIKKSLPTIKHCLDNGASLTIMSHLGRPNGKDSNFSLLPICDELENLLDMNIAFSSDCISDKALLKSSQLEPGQIHFLENLRFYNEEIVNDYNFSQKLAFHGDVYINDAFGTAHRSHASNVGVTKFFSEKSYGYLMEKELHYLKNLIENPFRPLTVVMGGAKISDKIELIKNFIEIADNIIIGGALSLPFLKSKNYDIHSSLFDDESILNAENLLKYAKKNNKKLILPCDFVTANSLDDDQSIDIKLLNEINAESKCFDIGPETTMIFSEILSSSDTILWNGPLGVCENPYFATGTQQVCRIIEELTANNVVSVLGGGDTASAANRFSVSGNFTHISTGGGASLELLSGKDLPAIKALDF